MSCLLTNSRFIYLVDVLFLEAKFIKVDLDICILFDFFLCTQGEENTKKPTHDRGEMTILSARTSYYSFNAEDFKTEIAVSWEQPF